MPGSLLTSLLNISVLGCGMAYLGRHLFGKKDETKGEARESAAVGSTAGPEESRISGGETESIDLASWQQRILASLEARVDLAVAQRLEAETVFVKRQEWELVCAQLDDLRKRLGRLPVLQDVASVDGREGEAGGGESLPPQALPARRALLERAEAFGQFLTETRVSLGRRQGGRPQRLTLQLTKLAEDLGALMAPLRGDGAQREAGEAGSEEDLERFILSVVPYVADLLDRDLDPERVQADLQQALANLFLAVEMEQIAPRKHDPFVPVEQVAVQSTPRESPTDKVQTVAGLVNRGFRVRGKIERKATVVLFH